MAITYPLSLPASPGIRTVRITPLSAVATSRSPFTFETQVYVHQGQRWRAEIGLPPMKRAKAEPWLAFLVALNGREGTFLIGDPDAATPRGAAASTPGTPVVKGGGQTGASLDIDGAPNSVTGYLLAGDYIQLGSGADARLHKVLEDADSDGSGNVTLTLWPKVTTAPSDNATVVVSDAKGSFRLAENGYPWDSDQAGVYAIAFTAESVV